jgi:hypothetical protein
MKYEIEQKLWLQGEYRSTYVTVTKVGHKWVTIVPEGSTNESYQIAVNDVWVKKDIRGISRGRIFHSKEEAEAQLEIQKEWQALLIILRKTYGTPNNLTRENLYALKKALRNLDLIL